MKKYGLSFFLVVSIILPNAAFAQVALQSNLFGTTARGSSILITSQQEKIAVRVEGSVAQSQKVFLFLNGIDRDMSVWDQVLSLMKEQHPNAAYVRLDLLGQGETSDLTPLAKIHFSQQVQVLKEIYDSLALNKKEVTFISHSYGGAIATRFVQEHPDAVAHNILIAPYVDFLETHHPMFSPYLSTIKAFSYAFGFKEAYEANIQLNSAWGTFITWSSYQLLKQTPAKLNDVIALTHGVRDVGMNQALEQAGSTRTSMIYGSLDELIPASAHIEMWSHVPATSQGSLIRIAATHDSVNLAPQMVFEALQSEITAP